MKYENLFHGKEKEALEKALDIRKFEIELYWKRTAYFWAFIVANYTAYFFVLIHEEFEDQKLYLTLLSFIGLLLAHAWQLANKGSKFWQKNWEAHVAKLEPKIIGPLYEVFLNPNTSGVFSPFKKSACSPAKINTIVCIIFFFTSLGLFLYDATLFWSEYNQWIVLGICIFLTIVCMFVMAELSLGHKHDDEPLEMIYSAQTIKIDSSDIGFSTYSIHHFVDRFFVETVMIGNQVWMQNNVSQPIYNGCVVSHDSSKIEDVASKEKPRNYRIIDSYCGGKIINYSESALYDTECDDGYLRSVLITPEDEGDFANNLFYSWEAAMNINLPGWRLPSLDEWMALFKHLMKKQFWSGRLLAQMLKCERGWMEKDYEGKEIRKEYENSFGFSACPEGSLGLKWKFTKNGEFMQNPTYSDIDDMKPDLYGKGKCACFWSSTKRENGDVACIWIEDYVTIRYVSASELPFHRHSVRLIKNKSERLQESGN